MASKTALGEMAKAQKKKGGGGGTFGKAYPKKKTLMAYKDFLYRSIIIKWTETQN